MTSDRVGRTAAFVLVAGLLVGCSGDDAPEPGSAAGPAEADSTSATPSPPTPAEQLGLATGWGPTADDLDLAARAVRRMSLPDLAGQVIVADWSGTAAPVRLVRSLHLGGVIAFDDNIASTAGIRSVNRTLEREVRRRWPLFLSVDQEGGIVERVQGEATRFPAFMSAGAADEVAATRRAAAASGAELRGLGFTVDFAPDADVTSGPGDPTIGSRSIGSDPDLVSRHVVAAATGLSEAGVVPVLKHFPGHGSVTADSHTTLPVQRRTRQRLDAIDLAPFRAAVDAGVPAVMVAHLDVRAIDPGTPSSLSRRVITGVLRGDLGFDGLVVTDSLEMAGAQPGRDGGARQAVRALRAGNDVLLMPPDPAAARQGIISAVRRGALDRTLLERAAARQIALLLASEPDAGRDRRGSPPGSGDPASRALSAEAITVAAGPCRGPLAESAVSPSGDDEAVASFTAAAQAAGLQVLLPRTPPARLTRAEPRPERAAQRSRWRARERRRTDQLATWRDRERARMEQATRIGFAGYGDGPVSGDVAVAVDTPYVLGSSDAPVRIATYGDTPGAMRALVAVLQGRARAPGRLPVAVPGLPRRGC
ncbi:glycoside hydrolase family 3 protein [Nocardioides sp.]|uniref:glycoside hydrolase family 3 protein n=1 Tax=Nocardioides sp. TaxID=35761 RepID=UPI002D8055FB|nr:glycoside hydrolase family 3 N-terminal domain-containing protein [Nocardioides sp.]HET8959947.1 glycoside hydrolase family 3 N-terminal domain-containing protein [Nocardioides sp.]